MHTAPQTRSRLRYPLVAGLLALLLLTIPAVAQSTDENATIKVRLMTFNIHHGAPEEGPYDLDATIGVMLLSMAKLIAVQEVDRNYSGRSNHDDQPQRLREALGAHVAYHPNIGDTYGNALITATPLKTHKNHPLPNPEQDEPRGVIHALWEVGGETYHVLATHMSAYDHSENRTAQTSYLIEMIRHLDGPVILMGDFNSTASTELGPLFADGTLVSSRAVLRLPEGIDDIIVSKDLVDRIVTGGEMGTEVSDHLPYWLTLRLGATTSYP